MTASVFTLSFACAKARWTDVDHDRVGLGNKSCVNTVLMWLQYTTSSQQRVRRAESLIAAKSTTASCDPYTKLQACSNEFDMRRAGPLPPFTRSAIVCVRMARVLFHCSQLHRVSTVALSNTHEELEEDNAGTEPIPAVADVLPVVTLKTKGG